MYVDADGNKDPTPKCMRCGSRERSGRASDGYSTAIAAAVAASVPFGRVRAYICRAHGDAYSKYMSELCMPMHTHTHTVDIVTSFPILFVNCSYIDTHISVFAFAVAFAFAFAFALTPVNEVYLNV